MGREGPAHLGSHWQGHLVALTLSLLLTCGPGKGGWGAGSQTDSQRRGGRCDRCLRLPMHP